MLLQCTHTSQQSLNLILNLSLVTIFSFFSIFLFEVTQSTEKFKQLI